MKHKLKQYLKIGTLLFGIFTVTISCEKNDAFLKEEASTKQVHTPKYKTSIVYSNTINKNENLKQALNKLRGTKTANQASKLILNDSLNIAIEDSSANYIETPDGRYHSYTFLAFNYDEPEGFDNLLLSLQPDGSYREFLFHYDLTKREIELFRNNEYVNLEGKVSFAELGSNSFAGDLFSKVTTDSSCLVWDVTEGQNCTAGGNHEYGEACSGTGDEVATEGGNSQLIGIDWDCIDGIIGGGGSTGSGGGPGTGSPGGGQTNNGGGNNPGQGDVSATNPPPCVGSDCPELPNPECLKITQLFTDYPTLRSELITLKGMTGLTQERGKFVVNTATVVQNPPIGATGHVEISATPSGKYICIAHTHNSPANTTYSVPSWEDLNDGMAFLLKNDKIDASRYVGFLFTADGTKYAFTINDKAKFLKFFALTFDSNFDMNTAVNRVKMRDDYYYKKTPGTPFIVENSTDNTKDLKHFLDLVHDNDLGLTVFNVSEDFNTFKELTHNRQTNMVDENPCL